MTGEPITLTFASDGPFEAVELSAQLRWSKSGVLQQAWIATLYNATGSPIGQRTDWRDIPTEE